MKFSPCSVLKKKHIGLVLVLMALSLLWIIPLIAMVIASLSGQWVYPSIFPQNKVSLFSSWHYVLSRKDTYTSLSVTLLLALSTTILDFFIALPAARVLARRQVPHQPFWETILILPIVLPPVALALSLHKNFIKLGLTESFWGLVLANIIPTLPYMIRALSIGYESIGEKWEKQAKALGASRFSIWTNVHFPMLTPAIAAGSGLCCLIVASQYILVLVIGGGLIKTLPLLMYPFFIGGNPAIGGAYSLLFTFFCLALFFILQISLKQFYKKPISK